MPEKKTREKSAKKFVEAAAEKELSESVHLVEKEESSPLVRDSTADGQGQQLIPEQAGSANEQQPESAPQAETSAPVVRSPGNFFKLNALNAMLFLVFPSVCCLTTLMVDPRLMHNSYCRTAMLCAFVWSLIGGVIFAQSRKAWERSLLFWLFAMPFALSGLVCSAGFQILLALMQELPPGLK